MTWNTMYRSVAARWRVAAAVIVIAVLAAGLGTFLSRPTFQSEARLFVSTRVGGADISQQLLQSGNFSAERVKSYVDLVTSPLVLQRASAKLGDRIGVVEIGRVVVAEVPLDTVLINISATTDDSAFSAEIANAVSASLAEVIQQIESVPGQPSPIRATLVAPAVPATSPSSPNVPVNIALGLIAGVVLGVGAAVARDRFDTSMRRLPEAIAASGLPGLGTVSIIGKSGSRSQVVQRQAEEFNDLRTNIRFVTVDSPMRTLVVTSSVEGEGKTTVTTQLARATSRAGIRTLVIDADLRRPAVSREFGGVDDVGLTNALTSRAPLSEVVQAVADNLHYLAAGRIPPNPSELLASERFRSVLLEAATSYELVLVDSAPVAPVSDTKAVAASVDGVVLVVRARSTRREVVTAATASLRLVGANLSGVVLNMADDRERSGYGYGYGVPPVQNADDAATRETSQAALRFASESAAHRR